MADSNDRATRRAALAEIRAARAAEWELARADGPGPFDPTADAATRKAALADAVRIGRAALTPDNMADIHRAVARAVGRYPGLDGHLSTTDGRQGEVQGRQGGGKVESETIDQVAATLGRMPWPTRAATIRGEGPTVAALAYRAAIRICRKAVTGRGSSPYVADAERQQGAPNWASWVSLDSVTGAALAATLTAPDRAEPVGVRPFGQPGRGPSATYRAALAAGSTLADAAALALAAADARAVGYWQHSRQCDGQGHTAAKCDGRRRGVRGYVHWPWVAAELAALGLATVNGPTARTMAARAARMAARADGLRAERARATNRAARARAVVAAADRARRRPVADAALSDAARAARAATRASVSVAPTLTADDRPGANYSDALGAAFESARVALADAARVGADALTAAARASVAAERAALAVDIDRADALRAARAVERATLAAIRTAALSADDADALAALADADALARVAADALARVAPIHPPTDAERADATADALALAGLA